MHCAARTHFAVVLLSLLTPLLVLNGAAANAATEDQASYAQQAFGATNNVREARDKVPLEHHACLQRFANLHANRLAERGELFHQDLSPILDACDLDLTGENLALGYGTGRAAVRDGWMHSPGHRANILERRYRVMVTAARQTDGGRWVAVQLFGRRK